MTDNVIPLYKPDIGNKELTAIKDVLNSKILSRGPQIQAFEDEFAGFLGKKYAVAVNSGTSALHLIVKSMGWKKGDEVITTPFSFIASGNALLYENIKPVFSDINPFSFNLDPCQAKEKITQKTKGILLVNIFGLPAYDNKFKAIKKKNGVSFIEDSCESLGRPSKKFRAGTLGEASAFGFYSNKQITTGGEGGIIVTDNREIAEFCRSARDQGRSNKRDWLNHVILGYNYRMTEIQAAIGRVQLKKFDKISDKKARIAQKYKELLKDIPGISLPYESNDRIRSWFIYYILAKDNLLRELLIQKLAENNIQSHRYFPSIHLFPHYKKFRYNLGDFPVSEKISDTLVALPFHSELSEREMFKIVAIIRSVANEYCK
jgi:perosamine synthetase